MKGFCLVQHGWAAHFYHFLSQMRLVLKLRNSGGFSVTNADGSLVGPWNAMVYSPLIGGLAERMGSFCRHQNACAPDAWPSLQCGGSVNIRGSELIQKILNWRNWNCTWWHRLLPTASFTILLQSRDITCHGPPLNFKFRPTSWGLDWDWHFGGWQGMEVAVWVVCAWKAGAKSWSQRRGRKSQS